MGVSGTPNCSNPSLHPRLHMKRLPVLFLAALITAMDGQVSGSGDMDRFRFKIWSSSGTVYDNQMTASEDSDAATALGGGSIRIHQK